MKKSIKILSDSPDAEKAEPDGMTRERVSIQYKNTV